MHLHSLRVRWLGTVQRTFQFLRGCSGCQMLTVLRHLCYWLSRLLSRSLSGMCQCLSSPR